VFILRIALLVPYTYVKYSVGRKSREVGVDSFTIVKVSRISRVALTVYPFKRLKNFLAAPHSITWSDVTVWLKREVAAWDVFKIVVNSFRQLKSEILAKAGRAQRTRALGTVFSTMFTPWFPRRVGEADEELRELVTASSLLESVIGRELLKSDPVIEEVREVFIALRARMEGGDVRIEGRESLMKVYSWLLRNDEGFRKAVLEVVYDVLGIK